MAYSVLLAFLLNPLYWSFKGKTRQKTEASPLFPSRAVKHKEEERSFRKTGRNIPRGKRRGFTSPPKGKEKERQNKRRAPARKTGKRKEKRPFQQPKTMVYWGKHKGKGRDGKMNGKNAASSSKFHFGVLGCGDIARKFCRAVELIPDAEVAAAAST